MLIYEMDVFHYSGTFLKAADKLPDLRAYGINTVWVLPPYTRFKDAPYSTNDFTKIDPRLGTNQDAKAFVDKAHSLGMKVLFDLTTIGHGCQAPTLEGVNPSDVPIVQARQAGTFPDLCEYKYCADTQAMIDFYTGILKQWVQDVGVDGFRGDTADTSRYDSCPDMQSGRIRDKFWTSVISTTRNSTDKELFFMAENTDLNLENIWKKVGFNSANAAFAGAFGWYDDVTLIHAVNQGDEQSYTALQQRVQRFTGSETGFFRLRRYLTNHDLWNYGVTGVTPPNVGGNPLIVFKSAAGVNRAYLLSLFTSSGLMSICNGQEFGYTQPENFNTASHHDDIDFSKSTAAVDAVYRFAGPLFVKYGDLFRDGQMEFCTALNSFAIVRVMGSRQIGLFIGDGCLNSSISKLLSKSILPDDVKKYLTGIDVRATQNLSAAYGSYDVGNDVPLSTIHV